MFSDGTWFEFLTLNFVRNLIELFRHDLITTDLPNIHILEILTSIFMFLSVKINQFLFNISIIFKTL